MAKATNGATSGPSSASGRNSVSRAVFVGQDGEGHRSPRPDTHTLRFDVFTGEKGEDGKPVVLESHEVKLEQFTPEINKMAAWHGIKKKIADEWANAATVAKDAGKTIQEVVREKLTDMLDNLESGVWVREGEGGGAAGNIKTLAEAIIRSLRGTDKAVPEGEEGAERRAALLKKLADDEAWASSARKNANVQFHLKTIEAERAQARLLKAKEALEGGTGVEAAQTALEF